MMTQPTMITTVIAWMIQEWRHQYFQWVDAVEVKKISDSERIFLAKIPRKALKGKDGVNIEYRFNKNGDVIYSSQYNVILDKKKGLNEVELSYYAGTDGVDVPEYNIYGK